MYHGVLLWSVKEGNRSISVCLLIPWTVSGTDWNIWAPYQQPDTENHTWFRMHRISHMHCLFLCQCIIPTIMHNRKWMVKFSNWMCNCLFKWYCHPARMLLKYLFHAHNKYVTSYNVKVGLQPATINTCFLFFFTVCTNIPLHISWAAKLIWSFI